MPSGPNDFPPSPGTQSGTVTEMELIPPMTALMAALTPSKIPSAIPLMPPKILLKISTMFCYAADQFPVKTPVMKSMMPVKTPMPISTTAATTLNAAVRTPVSTDAST